MPDGAALIRPTNSPVGRIRRVRRHPAIDNYSGGGYCVFPGIRGSSLYSAVAIQAAQNSVRRAKK
ncbi:hypothetical protein CUC50_19735 [Citrobacter werkmanii]|nr:hypothetical protein CUC50_19735 [Citrobacter werkmanii]